MKKLLVLCVLLATIATGCSQNHFNIPPENIAEKVRVLGVAPIMLDVNSDIRFTQKEQLITLLIDTNRKYEQQFVRKLKDSGEFNTTALLDGDSQATFSKLFFRRESRNDATIQYHKYFWKDAELREYMQKNSLDAVMLIVVSGLTRSDNFTSYGQMKSLTSDYNFLIMTAQILDANGTIIWEYPNFRQRFLSYAPMMNLEYPDFNEAEANLSTSVQVKFKTIEGIQRTLDKKRKDYLMRDTQESEVYGKQFDDMISLLKYDHDKTKKPAQPAVETPPPAQPVKTSEVKAVPAPTATKSAPVTQADIPEVTRVPVLEKQSAPTDEIVPAKGSTL